MDKKTVLNGINCCLVNGDPECRLCPYDAIDLRCRANLRNDLIDLLKAHEAQLVIRSRDYIEGTVLRCPKCEEVVHKYNGNYCSHCGQAVKWE